MQAICRDDGVLPPGCAVPALRELFAELSVFDSFPTVSDLLRLVRQNPIALNSVLARETMRLGSGSIAEEHPQDIHRLANASPRAPLVTLHVYAPPLRVMQTYVEVGGQIRRSA